MSALRRAAPVVRESVASLTVRPRSVIAPTLRGDSRVEDRASAGGVGLATGPPNCGEAGSVVMSTIGGRREYSARADTEGTGGVCRPDLEATSHVPEVLGHFRLREKLGEGGMGTVHRAEHLALGHSVAVKILRSTLAGAPRLRARFASEARALAMLRSDHIVRVFDYGITAGGTPYLVMEHLRGRTLSSAVEAQGPLPLPTVARIVTDIARGLTVAHAASITDRDVKPDNVFLEEVDPGSLAGPPYRAKLLDFGLARMGGHDETSVRPTLRGHFVGTLGYAAPEQVSGRTVGPAADLWALGLTAFAAVTGQAAIACGSAASIALFTQRAELREPSALVPSLPRGFDAWMRRACAADPEDRFGDARTMARALRAVALNRG